MNSRVPNQPGELAKRANVERQKNDPYQLWTSHDG